jgi:hypothetical protein
LLKNKKKISKALIVYQERRNTMAEVNLPHPGHDKHLCFLENIGYVKSNLDDYKELVRDSKFVCRNCGRAAANEKNLCKPERI